MAFRSWAAQDPVAAEGVRVVDLERYRFARDLFSEIGFAGDELEDRTTLWLVYQSAHRTVHTGRSRPGDEAELRRLHAFFTRSSD